ncbi:MAG: AIR carboxylase family protein [Patescibacteria group bacterium]|jgi:5-(carboxyamino)imidazole ribonucleotide mutase
MVHLIIMIGSSSDEHFLHDGLEYLNQHSVKHEVIVSSTHREPQKTNAKIIESLKNKNLKVIIGGAATATGLPGVIAGYLKERSIPIFGVRFTKNPGQSLIEDATFNLSSMPNGVPLAYTGYNEKGFLHACILAERIINS